MLLLAAVASAPIGYATGARLAAVLGAWQTICWALVIAMPISVPAMFLTFPRELGDVGLRSWFGFAYVIVVSQLLGFFAWYRGRARGGVARVAQIQNLQMFMTMFAGALLLGEPMDGTKSGFAFGATVFVALSQRCTVRSPLLRGAAVFEPLKESAMIARNRTRYTPSRGTGLATTGAGAVLVARHASSPFACQEPS